MRAAAFKLDLYFAPFVAVLPVCCSGALQRGCTAPAVLQCCSAAPACAGRDEDIKHDQNVKTDNI